MNDIYTSVLLDHRIYVPQLCHSVNTTIIKHKRHFYWIYKVHLQKHVLLQCCASCDELSSCIFLYIVYTIFLCAAVLTVNKDDYNGHFAIQFI